MSNHVTSSFKIESWDEEVFSETGNGVRLVRAHVTQSYTGDIKGESTIEYLMTTLSDDFTSFIGIEQFQGTVEGRSDSFVLKHEGTHQDGLAKSRFQIVKGSGTGELSGIRGSGHYEATHEKASFTLDYHFE